MEEKANLILGAEQALARRIALGCIVGAEVKWWLQAIPGMFIFDFLKRTGETRKYSQYYMFPCRMAMASAQARINGAQGRLNEPELRFWLARLKLNTDQILEKQAATVELLAGHYGKLLGGRGATSSELILSAYPRPADYQAHLDNLAASEAEFYQAVAAKLGRGSPGLERIRVIQAQSAVQRAKDLDAVYG